RHQPGPPPRSVHEFVKAGLWDQAGLTDAVQRSVRAALADRPADPVGTVGIIDETSALKSGHKTPGVQRQYLGCVGKIANGIVSVHLGVCRGRYKTLLDSELFLSEDWAADKDRRAEAGIPTDVTHRPKWQIALEG